jgi:hypothetical protein
MRKERTEPEAEEDLFDDLVALDEGLFVIPSESLGTLMHMRRLVQKDFADDGRRADAEVGRLPAPTRLLLASANREDADIERLLENVPDESRGMDPFALRKTHRDFRQREPKSDVVVDALQFALRLKTQAAQWDFFPERLGHSPDAPFLGAEVQEHACVYGVGSQPVGEREQFVLMVKAGRSTGSARMIRVHLSRRARAACDHAYARTRGVNALTAGDQETSG